MKFNEKLFELRKSKGLSQEALAEKLDVSRQAVSKWETGDAFPEAAKLLAIAKLFDVTTDYLLDEKLDKYTAHEVSNNNASIEKAASQAENLFRKYGWISGVLLIIYGAYRTIISLSGISQLIGAASATGNPGFIITPAFSVIIGAAITATGIILTLKLRKNK